MRSGRAPIDTPCTRPNGRQARRSKMEWDTDPLVVDAINQCLPRLERYVKTLVRDPDEAADVCQEACVRLLIETRAKGMPDEPGAWLSRVAHNLVVSAARRRQTLDKRADQLVRRDVAPAIDDVVIGRERDALIHQALTDASRDDRIALTMAAGGYPIRTIAAEIGRSELATRALLFRARARMRRSFRLEDGIGT